MFQAFDSTETIGIYFEIYNLKTDSFGKTNYEITCTLQQAEGKDQSLQTRLTGFFKRILGKEQGTVGTSFNGSGELSDDKIFLNLDVGGRDAGNYDLIINIKDKNENAKTEKRIGITLK